MEKVEIKGAGNEGVRLPILVYGRPGCDDTDYVREQMNLLHVPFAEVNIDVDKAAEAYVITVNHGLRMTPTIVFGAEDFIIVQPTRNELFQALRRAGYEA